MLNLYGHPLAGLYWERHCQSALLKLGFQLVKGWECLYFHADDRLFLSVYVDDFKMAGLKTNLSSMWSRIRKVIDLDDPVPLNGSTYLGCRQDTVRVTPEVQKAIDHQRELYQRTFRAGHMHSQQKVSDAEEQEKTASPGTSTRGVKEPSSGIGAPSKGTRRGNSSKTKEKGGNSFEKEVHSTHPVKV